MPFQQVAFVDNAPVIELLAAKPYGLMNLLDEEVRVAHAGGGRAVAAGRWRQGGTPALLTTAMLTTAMLTTIAYLLRLCLLRLCVLRLCLPGAHAAGR